MTEAPDWTQRVDQMTSATAHEQLRAVVREAQDALGRFVESSSDQAGLLLDAQREMELGVERRLADLSARMTEAIEEIRREIGAIEMRAPEAAAPDADLRSDLFAAVAALGEELDGEASRLREAIAARSEQLEARFDALEERLLGLEERLAGAEERAGQRVVDLLADAFSRLRSVPTPADGFPARTGNGFAPVETATS